MIRKKIKNNLLKVLSGLLFLLLCCFIILGADSKNVELVSFLGGGILNDVFVKDKYAYIAAESILSIVDISNPLSPKEVGYYDTPGSAKGVYVVGNYAYVADVYGGLSVIDILNPSVPKEVGCYNTTGNAKGVYVVGNYAYVANGKGLRVIDMSNPSVPRVYQNK